MRRCWRFAVMVVINVAQLLQSTTGATRQVRFAERLADPSPDLHLETPVRGVVRLLLTSRGVLAESAFRVQTVLACSRCLRDTPVLLDCSFAEEFRPAIDIRAGIPLPEPDDDVDYSLVNEHHEINLDEILRQTMITAVPLQPLCSATCLGLCPTCGDLLESGHAAHPAFEEAPAEVVPLTEPSPFAKLALLLHEPRDSDDRGSA